MRSGNGFNCKPGRSVPLETRLSPNWYWGAFDWVGFVLLSTGSEGDGPVHSWMVKAKTGWLLVFIQHFLVVRHTWNTKNSRVSGATDYLSSQRNHTYSTHSWPSYTHYKQLRRKVRRGNLISLITCARLKTPINTAQLPYHSHLSATVELLSFMRRINELHLGRWCNHLAISNPTPTHPITTKPD